MWVFAVYCLGAFNACQGYYRTEANPSISFAFKDEAECREKGAKQAQVEKFTNPQFNIVWRCIDISKTSVVEDTKKLP